MNIKMLLFRIMITPVLAFNRLQSFRNHHRSTGHNKADKGHTHLSTIWNFTDKQNINLTRRAAKNSAITRKEPTHTIINKICTSVTCTKCEKSVAYGVKQQFCTIILSLPNCCPKKHFLYTAFWQIYLIILLLTAIHLLKSKFIEILPSSTYHLKSEINEKI